MNVWLVNPFDNLPSEGNRAQRYWLMAEAFVRAGYAVTYWTGDFSHATKKRRVAVDGGASRTEGIEVVQIPTRPYGKNICLARILSHRKLACDFERLALGPRTANGRPRPDLVIASLPPLGLCDAARRVARKLGARFVADIQDAWPETFERLVPRFVLSTLGLYATARRLYRQSDAVSTVSARYIELAKEYGCTAPLHLAGHCVGVPPVASPDAAVRSAKRLAYIGNMSLSYDLETVIAVVREMPDVTLDVAGNGPDLPRLRDLARNEIASGKIRFHGYLGAQDLAALLRACDVGLVPMWPESCVGVPGKLADYAAARLGVIESLGGECGEIVGRYRVGAHYRAGSVSSLRSAIAETFRLEIAESDREAFAKSFDAREVMDGYVRWVVANAIAISIRVSQTMPGLAFRERQEKK